MRRRWDRTWTRELPSPPRDDTWNGLSFSLVLCREQAINRPAFLAKGIQPGDRDNSCLQSGKKGGEENFWFC